MYFIVLCHVNFISCYCTVSYFLVHIMLLYHDTFLFILCTYIMNLSYSYHNPVSWSWLLTVAGNSDPTRSLDRLWERLQDHVPHLHGEHLVGVQGAIQPGTSLQRVKGHALFHGLQHPTVQLWVRTELQGCGGPSRFDYFYSMDKLLYFYIDIHVSKKKNIYKFKSSNIYWELNMINFCLKKLNPLWKVDMITFKYKYG